MPVGNWTDKVDEVHRLLSTASFSDSAATEISSERGFADWVALTARVRALRGTVFLIGNGASASMASHMAADLAKNAGIRTEVFSDLSLITAVANDLGFENVFVTPMRRRCSRGDMLVAISSSGRSRNILAGTKVARDMGLWVVTVSAMSPHNPLRALGDINAYVAAQTYGLAETCHAALLHHWMDRVEQQAAADLTTADG